MKLVVLGLSGAAPELLLGQEDLPNFRRLMETGTFGRLESVVPPVTVPAWMSMATGQDPGSLGVYGSHDRSDRSYAAMQPVGSSAFREPALWDLLARHGRRSVVLGVPPAAKPFQVDGGAVALPRATQSEVQALLDAHPPEIEDVGTERRDRLPQRALDLSRRRFEVVRRLMRATPWDYLQFVETGLGRVQRAFWRHHDPAHPRHEAGPHADVVRAYYRHLDEEVGSLLESFDEETALLVVSEHGAQASSGGFCVNEWLMREGLLVVHRRPTEPTPLSELDIDWKRTTCWSEGGDHARIFLNVKGREPDGTVDPSDCERVRNELTARLEATCGPDGRPLGTVVFKPEEIYRHVRGVAPDLIVHFGGLACRAVGSVGHPAVHVDAKGTGQDECSPTQHGAFILAAPGAEARGEVEGAHLLDVAPTLLRLGGIDAPESMHGRSLLGLGAGSEGGAEPAVDEEERLIRERLSGLGYI